MAAGHRRSTVRGDGLRWRLFKRRDGRDAVCAADRHSLDQN